MSTTRPTVTVEIDFTTNLSAGLAYYEQVTTTAPYVYHRLQESAGTSAADASGNGATGTYAGTYTLNQTAGKPVTGETASRYVNFGGGTSTPGNVGFAGVVPANDLLTIEAWIYQASLSGSASTVYNIFLNAGTSAASSLLQFELHGDGRLRLYAGGGWTDSTAAVVTAATWYHLAVTVDGANGSVKMYVNGASVSVNTTNQRSPLTLSQTNTQWRWGSAVGQEAVSRIAEPAVYLQPLAASTISDHYNAAATVPFAGYTWTNVTSYLDDQQPLTRRFGRESGLAEVVPMELAFTLLNRDRRFEPEYTTGPYYPNVVPGRPCRVTMTQDAVTYDWAFGFIQDFPQDYSNDLVGRVPIVATCMLERMNQDSMGNRVFVQQLAGSRMAVLLNIAGQPASRRTLDAGANQVMAQTLEAGASGDHARQVARSDRGLFFFNGAGFAIFQDGSYRTTNTRATTSQGTLGRAEILYAAPVFHAPKAMIRNEIVLRRPGGVDQTAEDSTSRGRYGRQTYSDELLLTTDAATATRASTLLAAYKDPKLRIRSVTFNPQQGAGFFGDSLGVRLSDRYTWTFQPLQGSQVSRDVFVEGVSDTYQFRVGEYLSTWFLNLV